jgi:hypothetical protein
MDEIDDRLLDDGLDVVAHAVGNTIASLALVPSGSNPGVYATQDRLELRFTGGGGVLLSDDGQSCCEHRYMSTDDTLDEFAGSRLCGISVRRDLGRAEDDDGETHEQAAVVIETSRGRITLVTHNEHNGYYGGFVLSAKPLD